MLGFELMHIGINMEDLEAATKLSGTLAAIFDMEQRVAEKGIFVGECMEVMNYMARGTHGHIAIGTYDVDRAIYHLGRKGITFDENSRKSDSKGTNFIYIDGEFGGFPIHLVRK